MLLFRTIHGSHLYGLNHEGSDSDYFEVHTNVPKDKARYAQQSIDGKYDLLKTDLSTFMQYANKGVPQYLEAMYSTMAEVDFLGDMRFSYRPSYTALQTYRRTAKNFYFYALENNDHKRMVHSLRISDNLYDLMHGRPFNPTLSPEKADKMRHQAHLLLSFHEEDNETHTT